MSASAIEEKAVSREQQNGSNAALLLVAKISLTVFIAEAAVMLLLTGFDLPTGTEAILDATLLTLLVCPGFYYWIYRPLSLQISEKSAIEHSLRQALQQQQQLNLELQQAQDQVVQSERLASLGLLTAGIAHEIRGPVSYVDANLNSLGGYCDDLFRLIQTYRQTHRLLGEDHELIQQLNQMRNDLDIEFLQQDTADLIRESKQGTERVKKIIENYKDFSRKSDHEWEQVDIHQGIESTLTIVWNELKYTAEVIKEYGQVPLLQCIPSELNQVLMNLLVNAGHAIGERGTITIRTGSEGDSVWFSVSDSGCGMSKEQTSRIFEPFFTTKPRGKGTGLGLAISMGIIEKHHGRIEVESALGEGSTFKVTLPVAQPAEQVNPPNQ